METTTITTFESPQRPLRKIEELERIVCARTGGAAFLNDFMPLAEEAQHLVGRNRRVAAIWQRHAGPAFARAVVESGFDEQARIPQTIGEVPLEGLLIAMADALQRFGSPSMRRAIADHALELLHAARIGSTLCEVIDALAGYRQDGAVRFGDRGERLSDA